jgi:drug/metabolite transporter (DMT)-like permease
MPELPVGLLYGLGAAVTWGITDVVASFGGQRLGSLRVLVLAQVIAVTVAVGLALILGDALPADPWVTVGAIVVGLAGAVAYLSFFTALRIGPLSVVSPITAAYGGLTVVLAVLLLGEALSVQQAIGAAVATGGIVLAGLIFDGGLRSARIVGPGVVFAIVALIMFAVMTIGSAHLIDAAGWLPVLLIARLSNGLAALGLLGVATRWPGRLTAPLVEAPLPPTRRAIAFGLLAGLFDVLGLVSFTIGLEQAETWLVGLASSFGPAIAVLVGVALLRERPRRTQWLGLVLIGVGMVLVATGGDA